MCSISEKKTIGEYEMTFSKKKNQTLLYLYENRAEEESSICLHQKFHQWYLYAKLQHVLR